MSIETFFEAYRLPFGLKDELGRLKTDLRARNVIVSFVGALGERIAREGSSGLKAVAYKRLRERNNFSSPEGWEAQMSNTSRNVSAIILGQSIVAQEQTLISGIFEYPAFLEKIHAGLVGTAAHIFGVKKTKEVELLTTGQMNCAREAARIDPTLSIFFQQGNEELLPQKLREFLNGARFDTGETHMNVMAAVRSILPGYKAVADVLLEDIVIPASAG